jgi:hypothetical protein
MKYQAALTLASQNVKTGPMPVSMTTAETCPYSCPLRGNGCYAECGNVAIHWRKVTKGDAGLPWDLFCQRVRNDIQPGMIWRHNVAGDLPGDGKALDLKALGMLVTANRERRGFTFTHYDPRNPWNASLIRSANHYGFTVNLSANNLKEADEFVSLKVGPVVAVVPDTARDYGVTDAGNKWIVCPAQTRKQVNCLQCQLCQKAKRKVIIAFRAHGTRRKAANAIAAS